MTGPVGADLYAQDVPRPRQEAIRAPSNQARHVAALEDLDALLQSAAAMRVELRGFEAALRRARSHLARGGGAEQLHGVLDITAARAGLTRAAAEFQLDRRNSRLSMFRAQLAEGMSIGAIARSWGLSRQLVSRTLREAGANGSGADDAA